MPAGAVRFSMGIGLIVTILPYAVLKSDSRETQSPWTRLLFGNVAYECPLKCYLVSNLNRARFWLHAGNHIEPEEEIRNRAYFHARDSDLPLTPVLNLVRFGMDSRQHFIREPSPAPPRAETTAARACCAEGALSPPSLAQLIGLLPRAVTAVPRHMQLHSL